MAIRALPYSSARWCRLDHIYGFGSCDYVLSGLNRAAFTFAVYASQPGLPSVATQDSLPAGGLP
jgi:hypothetical protein